MAPQIAFILVVIGLALYNAYDVWELRQLGKIFPLTVSAITLVFAFIGLARLSGGRLTDPMVFDSEVRWREREENYQFGLYHYLFWIGGFMLLIYVFGFIAAIGLFFVVFLRTKSEAQWVGHPADGGQRDGRPLGDVLCVRP